MKLYVFNPDTDMALADNNENYMSTASARRMAQDLALLPIWYAQPGSAVLAPSAYNADYLEKMKTMFPLSVQLVTEPELSECAEFKVMPWGWNPAIRKRMLKGGIAERNLPTMDKLEEYRRLSSRIQSLGLYLIFDINDQIEYVCGYRGVLFADGDMDFILKIPGYSKNGCVFKSLWSGSGKGLRWCRHGISKSSLDWCNREMLKHGSVIVEPIYNKVGDFAMEFYSDGQGRVNFTGYSRFSTDEKGAYQGNMLVSDSDVEQWLLQYVPLETVVNIRERILQSMNKLYGESYTGPYGVDMMVCRDENGLPYAIHPHVEINVRMTMGMVAHELYRNFIAPGSTGQYMVKHYPSGEELRAAHEQDMQDYPLAVKDGRVVSGYLPLVPVTPQSRYRAYMICKK